MIFELIRFELFRFCNSFKLSVLFSCAVLNGVHELSVVCCAGRRGGLLRVACGSSDARDGQRAAARIPPEARHRVHNVRAPRDGARGALGPESGGVRLREARGAPGECSAPAARARQRVPRARHRTGALGRVLPVRVLLAMVRVLSESASVFSFTNVPVYYVPMFTYKMFTY